MYRLCKLNADIDFYSPTTLNCSYTQNFQILTTIHHARHTKTMLLKLIVTVDYIFIHPLSLIETSDGDSRFFSAALGSTDRDFRIAFTNVSLSNTADPNTLHTSELFRTVNNDRWLDCKYVNYHLE